MSKTINDFKCHKSNPFLKEVLPHIKDKPKLIKFNQNAGLKLLNGASGEVSTAVQMVYAPQHVDTQEFKKVYLSFLGETLNLDKAGQKVLMYLWGNNKKDSDEVEFRLSECKKHTGFKSNQSVYNGLTALLEKKFIAKTEKHYLYFINPTLFFNGNRISLIKEYIADPKLKALPESNEF